MIKRETCYLDNMSTTKLDVKVIEVMNEFNDEYIGNASSQHRLGVVNAIAIERAKTTLGNSLNVAAEEIYFTSGGTESNNLAIQGVLRSYQNQRVHLITSTVEHSSVRELFLYLQKNKLAEISFIDVDKTGVVKLDQLEKSIKENTVLVSFIHGNNEIGSLLPLEEIRKITKNTLLHIDACQSFAKTALDLTKIPLDLLSINGHKIHGPKGIGALYIKKGTKISPLLFGESKLNHFRPGTLPTDLIIGIAKAVEIFSSENIYHLKNLQNLFLTMIKEKIPEVKLIGPKANRLCSNLNVRFPNINARYLAKELSKNGIYVSTSSACTSHTSNPSHVLTAIGMTPSESLECIRIGLSKLTTISELNFAINQIYEIICNAKEKNDEIFYH